MVQAAHLKPVDPDARPGKRTEQLAQDSWPTRHLSMTRSATLGDTVPSGGCAASACQGVADLGPSENTQ